VLLAVGLPVGLAVSIAVYVRSNPIIFNESFAGHAHCIKQSGLSLLMWAHDHGGQFPFHTNGYGDALLMMTNYFIVLGPLTGPGYDTRVFEEALATNGNVPEERCGRVYVQGLWDTNSPEIAVLFDKLASPGVHRGGFRRLWAPFGREVGYLGGSMQFIRDPEWPAFATEQIKLLEAAGIPKTEAERLYGSIVK
jgi:hypothetical protein